MPARSSQSDPAAYASRDLASILDQLACPACLAALQMDSARLVCVGCGRAYPIVDGIPVLITEPKAANP